MEEKQKGINCIKLSIYFHTGDGKVHLPQKVAFKAGIVCMPTNHKQGIRASDAGSSYFGHSQGSVMDAIKECLKANGIKLVQKDKANEYKKFVRMESEQKFFDADLDI